MIEKIPDITLRCYSQASKNRTTQDPYKDDDPAQCLIDERFKDESVYEAIDLATAQIYCADRSRRPSILFSTA